MKNNKLGFTLIELLVVIAIIAILAAILFPVFAKVREKARQTSCLSNEKQIGLALEQYTQDYDETYPCGNSYADGEGWASQIYTYVKSTGAYKCPDDSNTVDNAGAYGIYYPLSYAYNRNLVTKPTTNGTTTTSGTVTIASLQSPSSTVSLSEVINANARIDGNDGSADAGALDGDSCTSFGNYGFDGYGQNPAINPANGHGNCLADTGYMGNPSSKTTGGLSNQLTGRHTNGTNFVMTDGHAKWLQPGSVSPGMNAELTTDAQGVHSVTYGGEGPFPTAAGTSSTLVGFGATFSIN